MGISVFCWSQTVPGQKLGVLCCKLLLLFFFVFKHKSFLLDKPYIFCGSVELSTFIYPMNRYNGDTTKGRIKYCKYHDPPIIQNMPTHVAASVCAVIKIRMYFVIGCEASWESVWLCESNLVGRFPSPDHKQPVIGVLSAWVLLDRQVLPNSSR